MNITQIPEKRKITMKGNSLYMCHGVGYFFPWFELTFIDFETISKTRFFSEIFFD